MKYLLSILMIFSCSKSWSLECVEEGKVFKTYLESEKHTVEGPFTIEQLENINMIEVRETKEVIPFGYSNKLWLEFKSKIRKGDSIYFVKLIDGKAYYGGHILVREGCIIEFLMGVTS